MSDRSYPVNLNVRMSLEQHARLREIADANECSMSEAARLVFDLGYAQVSPDGIVTRIAELRRAGKLAGDIS